MLIKIFKTAIVISALMAMSAVAIAKLERPVSLKARADIHSQNVCLQDITDSSWVKSRCQFDSKNCCRWSLSGSATKIFTRAELQRDLNLIDFGGISIQLLGSSQGGSDQIEITQARKEISGNEIKARLESWIAQKNTANTEEQIEVLGVKIPLSILVPIGNEESWQIQFPQDLKELNNLKIVSSADPTETLGWAEVQINKKILAMVAIKNIHPMEKIKIEDFESRMVSLSSLNQALGFTKANFPEGMRARLSVRSGMPLTMQAVERLPIVQTGDAVTLILKSDNLKISTKGVAQGSAAAGDTVSVQLPRFNRSFRGKLQDSKTVEVWF